MKFALEGLLSMMSMPRLTILNKSPFESARSTAERLRVSRATVLNYLHLSIDFKSFHLRWVPHLLTENLGHYWMLPSAMADIIL
jgi:hypothetical protein